MNSKYVALAAAVALALVAGVGGIAAAEHVYSASEDPSDEQTPDEEAVEELQATEAETLDGEIAVDADGDELTGASDTFEVTMFQLADAEIELVDVTGDLDAETLEALEDQLRDDSAVNSEVNDLIQRDGDADDWTAIVYTTPGDSWSDGDNVLQIELSHEATDDSVRVSVDLDDMEFLDVATVYGYDPDAVDSSVVNVHSPDDEDGEVIDVVEP